MKNEEQKPKNPPAFPKVSMRQTNEQSESNDFCYEERGQEGMSLRDYFAAKALIGEIYSTNGGLPTENVNEWYQRCAKRCYTMADAMLKQREI